MGRPSQFPRGLGPRERLLATIDSLSAETHFAWRRADRDGQYQYEKVLVDSLCATLIEAQRPGRSSFDLRIDCSIQRRIPPSRRQRASPSYSSVGKRRRHGGDHDLHQWIHGIARSRAHASDGRDVPRQHFRGRGIPRAGETGHASSGAPAHRDQGYTPRMLVREPCSAGAAAGGNRTLSRGGGTARASMAGHDAVQQRCRRRGVDDGTRGQHESSS